MTDQTSPDQLNSICKALDERYWLFPKKGLRSSIATVLGAAIGFLALNVGISLATAFALLSASGTKPTIDRINAAGDIAERVDTAEKDLRQLAAASHANGYNFHEWWLGNRAPKDQHGAWMADV